MQILGTAYRILVQVLCIPLFLSDYFDAQTGSKYGVGFWTKLKLAFKMMRNNSRIISGSTFVEHLAMATAILKIPKELKGVVVECGSYKGASAANLSLVCALIGRTFQIFDSFEGLPEPSKRDSAHTLLSSEELHTYTKGSWCGTLDEVKDNITKYGRIDVCRFNKGYFNETLPSFGEPCVFIWLDVDYRDSLETCLQYLWPLLQNGCPLYTHEAGHHEIASLFFSESWWKSNLRNEPPGLVGAGTGLGFKILSGSYFNSSIGYTIKNPETSNFYEVPQLGGVKVNLQSSIKIAGASKSRN